MDRGEEDMFYSGHKSKDARAVSVEEKVFSFETKATLLTCFSCVGGWG